ncbi:hypothetical protein CEUSTIGMA_g1337.t1 [Chlamydomonas eustigma]|uniref:Uncharacterized protein n=1 Tax=Chlamydomonas eustigma TaxID=1157962 RepID=A0A250WSS0_9CHLO|nr:hypothetical protein CEUSTIGMA_g1337.t1 [Chlamydomonas eustigma]|eukprot:GAX73887.1 hypothetical protein CEUSTIGMA_g1337.t1 [Chlamydomonas eustigma]
MLTVFSLVTFILTKTNKTSVEAFATESSSSIIIRGEIMSIGAAFRKAVFVEPVMVWSLMMYASALAVAVAVPTIKPYFDAEKPKTPPSLKEVMAGIQAKLTDK